MRILNSMVLIFGLFSIFIGNSYGAEEKKRFDNGSGGALVPRRLTEVAPLPGDEVSAVDREDEYPYALQVALELGMRPEEGSRDRRLLEGWRVVNSNLVQILQLFNENPQKAQALFRRATFKSDPSNLIWLLVNLYGNVDSSDNTPDRLEDKLGAILTNHQTGGIAVTVSDLLDRLSIDRVHPACIIANLLGRLARNTESICTVERVSGLKAHISSLSLINELLVQASINPRYMTWRRTADRYLEDVVGAMQRLGLPGPTAETESSLVPVLDATHISQLNTALSEAKTAIQHDLEERRRETLGFATFLGRQSVSLSEARREEVLDFSVFLRPRLAAAPIGPGAVHIPTSAEVVESALNQRPVPAGHIRVISDNREFDVFHEGRGMTLGDLKSRIQQNHGIDPSSLRLNFNGRELKGDDSTLLKDLGIVSGSYARRIPFRGS